MVQIIQNEDEIKISIELNRLITRKPDIVLLPKYIKFNNPPIFFERHLTKEIDDISSFCRIFKTEARLVLIKKEKGIWPEIFQNLPKEELFQKRLEIADLIIARNKERDEKALERYDQKRRLEIEKEVKRETAMRERVKQFEQNACREAMTVAPKETHIKPASASIYGRRASSARITPSQPKEASAVISHPVLPPLRSSGKINVNFTNFQYSTPKRESQEGKPRPFSANCAKKSDNSTTAMNEAD